MEGAREKNGKIRKNNGGKFYPPIGLGVGLCNKLRGPLIQYGMIREQQMENIDEGRKRASRHPVKT